MRNRFKPGDLIGFSGFNAVSAAINLATVGIPFLSLSHVAIVDEIGDRGEVGLIESTTLDDEPCVITGRRIKGVQAHWIESRVAGYKGRVWHYPLSRELFIHERVRLTDFLRWKIGLPYDEIGATRCCGLLWPLIENRLHESCLASLWCSELCAAAANEIGIFPTAYCGRWSPNHLVREMRSCGLLKTPVRLK